MTRPKPCTPSELTAGLEALAGWSVDEQQLFRRFEFPSFLEAVEFMRRGARHAEELDHHPDWRNVYATVDVWLSTHDVGAITALDLELARRLSEEAASR